MWTISFQAFDSAGEMYLVWSFNFWKECQLDPLSLQNKLVPMAQLQDFEGDLSHNRCIWKTINSAGDVYLDSLPMSFNFQLLEKKT